MPKEKVQYRCQCGFIASKWLGQCPSCKSWGTLEEEKLTTSKLSVKDLDVTQKLKDVKINAVSRIVTGITEFDRVLGGGIVPDSVNILTAPPGAGKSTLLLQVAHEVASRGFKALYVSGEESASQIKQRAVRLFGNNIANNIWIKSETNINIIMKEIEKLDADLIIIDSIQTLYTEDLDNAPGSIPQVTECTHKLLALAKNPQRNRAVFIVGQMTKDDELMGTRKLEHLVDTVLYLDGDRKEQLRTLYTTKNRFGSTEETGLFKMEEKGLTPINNPSQFFITKRTVPVSGSALTITKAGTRSLVVEIEALVAKTFYGYPIRLGEGINKQELQILTAILEKRVGLPLGDKDVYVKVTGGLKLTETAVNLGVVMAIASSLKNFTIPQDTVFIGEVGLTGELKMVPEIETRIKEVARLGFSRVILPKGYKGKSFQNLQLISCENLAEVVKLVTA